MFVHHNINDLRQTFPGENSGGTYLRPPRERPSGRPVLPKMPARLHPREERMLEDCLSSWHGRLWGGIVFGFSHHMRGKPRADPGYNSLKPGFRPVHWRHDQLRHGGHPSTVSWHSSQCRRRPHVCANRCHTSWASRMHAEKVPHNNGLKCWEFVHQHHGD
jgi:hypothetical protein